MDHVEKELRADNEAEHDDEEVDPRIQGELEKLNQSTGDINRCETALEAQLEAQKATQDFQGATEVLRAAKETISLAEQRLLEEDDRQFDSAWQEMLNHATQRVMEAEHTKTRSELVHKETAAKYAAAIGCLKQLEKKLKRTINKSKPYFEMKAKYYLQLENLKKNVDERQAKLCQAKGEYKAALRNLEKISDEIHERRRSSTVGPRGCGVGAEGDGAAVDDMADLKVESDRLSMASECFDDEAGGRCSIMSEEDLETRSTCSLGSSPSSPQELLSPRPFAGSSSSSSCSSSASPSPTPSSSSRFPPSRPCSLDLPGTASLSDFGLISPVFGPRSACSGASSPECELERGDRAEGAEGDLDNAAPPNNNSSSRSSASSSQSSASSSSSSRRSFSLETRFSFLNLRRPRGTKNTKDGDGCSQKAEGAVVLVKGV
ncbi:SH3 domain-binding protein 5b isoform X2 [Gasterosteus aculeatus]